MYPEFEKLLRTWYRESSQTEAGFFQHWEREIEREINRQPRIPLEEFEGMFATAEDDVDADPMLDFRIAPDFDGLLDTLTEEELEAVEAHLEGKPS